MVIVEDLLQPKVKKVEIQHQAQVVLVVAAAVTQLMDQLLAQI
jgi:hypothetical protein